MNQIQTKTLGIALVVIALALGITGMLFVKRPALYAATTVVKVERNQTDLPELTAAAAVGLDKTYFLQTEITLIRSGAILNKVIEQLDLNDVWGKRLNEGQRLKTAKTFEMLKTRVQVQPGSETELIIIKVISDNANEAALIANTTAQVYGAYRADYRRRLIQTALDALAGSFAEMEKQIASAQEKVEQAGARLDPVMREQAFAEPSPADYKVQRKALMNYLMQSNLLVTCPTNADVEIVERLKANADQARAEMIAAETASHDALRKQQSLKEYQAALFELEDLNKRFAPLQKAVEGLRNDLRLQAQSPIQIVEAASTPTKPEVQEAARGRMFLGAGGVALALGIGLWLFGRKPGISPA